MYKLLIITTFFVFFKQNYFATSNFEKIARKSINDSTYLVIGLEETDQSAVNSVRLQIETLSNCKILAYSNKLNVFILKFNNTNDLNDSNLVYSL